MTIPSGKQFIFSSLFSTSTAVSKLFGYMQIEANYIHGTAEMLSFRLLLHMKGEQ
jgi:hypothetical protein